MCYFCCCKKEEKWLFLKDALWGGGGAHRSWPGGRGGRPRALIPGEGVHKAGFGGRGGCKGFGSGGVGGRGTGPRDGANFATCVVFLLFLTRTKRRKMAFLKDALWGGGGTHRSWPGGRGGEGVREGLAWQAKAEQLARWTGGSGNRGGGARASVPGGGRW